MKILGLYKVLILFIVIGCGSKQTNKSVANISKTINDGNFMAEFNWAIPQAGNQINLIDNPSFLKFKKDSVEVDLPYFGTRQLGGVSNSNGGINYKGKLENLRITEVYDNNMIRLNFETSAGSEDFKYSLLLYSNGNSRLQVNSNYRSSISYRGIFKELE